MSDYWFKPRRYGYGVTPKDWRGWMVVLALAMVDVGLTVWLMVLPTLQKTGPSLVQFLAWFGLTALTTLIFVIFSRAKTDGEWRWRWGERD